MQVIVAEVLATGRQVKVLQVGQHLLQKNQGDWFLIEFVANVQGGASATADGSTLLSFLPTEENKKET